MAKITVKDTTINITRESVYKVVLKEHQMSKGKNNINYLKLSMTQVPFALSFVGYSFEKDFLNELFGYMDDFLNTIRNFDQTAA